MSDSVKFTVTGDPRGKQRVRVTKAGRAYTPKQTVEYERLIRNCYLEQCGGEFFEEGIPLKMEVDAYLSIPKSAPKKIKALMMANKLRPLKKPDGSNILKSIEDALNTVAYHDDAQLVESIIRRWYSETPRVEVEITALHPFEGQEDPEGQT